MTKREFYEAIIKGEMNEELQTFAATLRDKLDHTNELRKSKPTKASVANEPIKAEIINLLRTNPVVMTASEVATEVGVSTSKASAILRTIEDLVVSEVKGKSGKVKGYRFG